MQVQENKIFQSNQTGIEMLMRLPDKVKVVNLPIEPNWNWNWNILIPTPELPHFQSNQTGIEIDSRVKKIFEQRYLPIEPNWNWNYRLEWTTSTGSLSSNRTKLELKCVERGEYGWSETTSNRTKLELKLHNMKKEELKKEGFQSNQTGIEMNNRKPSAYYIPRF